MQLVTGVIIGLLGPVLGFFIYALLYVTYIRPHLDMHYFIQQIFLGTRMYQAPIISLSLIADLPLFLLFNWLDRPRIMRGILISMFIYGAIIIMLWI